MKAIGYVRNIELITLELTATEAEMDDLAEQVKQRLSRLPYPPDIAATDDSEARALLEALKKAKADLADAERQERNREYDLAAGLHKGADGALALIDEREAAKVAASRARARLPDLLRLHEKARQDVHERQRAAQAEAAGVLRRELLVKLEEANARVARALMEDVAEALALRAAIGRLG
jgi:hypothetical protein